MVPFITMRLKLFQKQVFVTIEQTYYNNILEAVELFSRPDSVFFQIYFKIVGARCKLKFFEN